MRKLKTLLFVSLLAAGFGANAQVGVFSQVQIGSHRINSISDDSTLANQSHIAIPTEYAVLEYFTNHIKNLQFTPAHTYIKNTLDSMLAINDSIGTMCILNDSSATFVLKVQPATDFNNWVKLKFPAAVPTVFGRTGSITAQESDYSSYYPTLSGSYSNPSWLYSLVWSKITSTPSTLSGYGIGDAYTKTEVDNVKAHYVASITALENYTGNSNTVIVQDSLRGGTFNYVASATPDSGTVFPRFGGGYWKRQFSGDVNVKWFGAKGDSSTDDTYAINQAFKSGFNSYIPAGKYMVNDTTGVLYPQSNTHITLNKNAYLIAIANRQDYYTIVAMQDVNNVIFEGGHIVGERYAHTGSTGGYGLGIAVNGSSNITVKNVEIRDCWGDGFNVKKSASSSYSSNINLIDCDINHNRRNNITVQSVHDILITRNEIDSANGTVPQAAIDIEPNAGDSIPYNVNIAENYMRGNTGSGVNLGSFAKQVDISKNYINGVDNAITISPTDSTQSANITIDGNVIKVKGSKNGIYRNSNKILNVLIKNNTVTGDGYALTTKGVDLLNTANTEVTGNSFSQIHIAAECHGPSTGFKFTGNEVDSCYMGFTVNSATQLSGPVITGNKFVACTAYGVVVLDSLYSAQISGNTFATIPNYAMYGKGNYNNISNNLFYNSGTTNPATNPAISILSNSQGNVVKGNIFRNSSATHYDISIAATTGLPNINERNDINGGTVVVGSGNIDYDKNPTWTGTATAATFAATSVVNAVGDFVTRNSGTGLFTIRTAAQVAADIGALTPTVAANTYLPFSGGTMTGPITLNKPTGLYQPSSGNGSTATPHYDTVLVGQSQTGGGVKILFGNAYAANYATYAKIQLNSGSAANTPVYPMTWLPDGTILLGTTDTAASRAYARSILSYSNIPAGAIANGTTATIQPTTDSSGKLETTARVKQLLASLNVDLYADKGVAINTTLHPGHLTFVIDSLWLDSTVRTINTTATSGTYTPTLTNTTNITSSTLTSATYQKVGNVVTVHVSYTINPTVGGSLSKLTITLPFTTSSGTQNYVGSGAGYNGGTSISSSIVDVVSTTTATVSSYPPTTSTNGCSITFQYTL
ncbi:MAG: right-handed parallel beta-helix repeat-containing protein [Bacteroidota bacterium]|nr:right-handed parallel beta-helix repeat-containing protein [Bacteroidota bacterium]